MVRSGTIRRCALALGVVVAASAVARAQSPNDGFTPVANGDVYRLVVQPDGRILVGGAFTALGGVARTALGRLRSDGRIDAPFAPNANNTVAGLAVQPDGKILVGGSFTTLGGEGRSWIGRLNADGTLDVDFNPGADGSVQVIALQPDGKILVGGSFTMLGGQTRHGLGRLHADGSLDASFNPGVAGGSATVFALAVQPDGTILVGGNFLSLAGQSQQHFGALTAAGAWRSGFPVSSQPIFSIALQDDRRILIGGAVGIGVRRMHANGWLDSGFTPPIITGGPVLSVTVHPDGRILIGGGFTTINGQPRNRIARLNARGGLDAAFNPGANDLIYTIAVQPDDGIVSGGTFTTFGGGGTGIAARVRLARVHIDGLLDTTFTAGALGSPLALTVQPDGKVVASGLNGHIGDQLTRHNRDGSPDLFPAFGTRSVTSLVLQPDGKILAGGSELDFDGQLRTGIARLNADATLDSAFNPVFEPAEGDQGVRVHAIALQPDGKILVGGSFGMIGGQPRTSIGRLNADGTLDSAFNPVVEFESPGEPDAVAVVQAIAVQTDGKILVGGQFTRLGGQDRHYAGRLNADGSLDTSFVDPGANAQIDQFALQPDGRILVGGNFETLGGEARDGFFGRLNADGSLDPSFVPASSGADNRVHTFALQADGRILVGGFFTMWANQPRSSIARLHADGSLDAWNPAADYFVSSLSLQADGKILAAGGFQTLGNTEREYIGRLTNPDAAIQRLEVTAAGSVVTWWRSGSAPEVTHVTFESSFDGVTYQALGLAGRIPGGWQLAGQSLARNRHLFVRARGFVTGAIYNGSTTIVESVRDVFIGDPFVDDPLTPGVTLIRAAQVAQMRARVDEVRARYAVSPFSWTDPSLVPGTIVRAVHFNELQTALVEAYGGAGLDYPAPTSTQQPGETIGAIVLETLRNALVALETQF